MSTKISNLVLSSTIGQTVLLSSKGSLPLSGQVLRVLPKSDVSREPCWAPKNILEWDGVKFEVGLRKSHAIVLTDSESAEAKFEP